MALEGNRGMNSLVRAHRRAIEMFGLSQNDIPTFSLAVIQDDFSLQVQNMDDAFPIENWYTLEPLTIEQNFVYSEPGGDVEERFHDHVVPLPDQYHRPLPGETVLVAWLGPNIPVVLGVIRRYTPA